MVNLGVKEGERVLLKITADVSVWQWSTVGIQRLRGDIVLRKL